jgi:hypothetical protein
MLVYIYHYITCVCNQQKNHHNTESAPLQCHIWSLNFARELFISKKVIYPVIITGRWHKDFAPMLIDVKN